MHSVYTYSLFGIPNRSAFDFMFVLAEIFYKFHAGNFSYYAGIMLHAFQPLLCLKLCWHNRLKPTTHCVRNEISSTDSRLVITQNEILITNIITNVTGFAKPATYAHNGKEHFSSPINSSIKKLTNCHNTTATS